MIGFIKAWRLLISPLYGQVCRYWPSCSAYGLEAVQTHGAWKGGRLTVKRIARCNPWSAGGYDPVPGTPAAREWEREQAADRRRRQDFTESQLSDSSATSNDEGAGADPDGVATPGDAALRVVPDEQTGPQPTGSPGTGAPRPPGTDDVIDHRTTDHTETTEHTGQGGGTETGVAPPAGNQR